MKEFLKYTSLNVLGMIGLSCYILADTFFVAKGLGSNGLAALNLAIPIYSLIHGSGLMFGMGGAARYSMYKHQGKERESNKVFFHTVLLLMFFAIIFFITGLLFSNQISSLLGADEVVLQMCKTYLQVILLFAPVFLLNDVMICFVRNDGAPQLSMVAMLGGSISNIILDYVFMFPLHMGIFGAVLATGLAPVISLLILSPYFFTKRNSFHLIKTKVSTKLCQNVFVGGAPFLVTELSAGIVMIIFNSIILLLAGNTGVAAYGVIANLSLVVLAVYTGIAQGVQPLMSKYYGMRNSKKIKAILKYALVLIILISVVIYSGTFLGADVLARMFNSEGNLELQVIAVRGLKIYFIACIFAGLNIIASVYLVSTGAEKSANIISLLRGFVIIIPMSFILSQVGGINGLWAVFPATEFLVALLSIYKIRHRKVNLTKS